jgi:hypothetical protein
LLLWVASSGESFYKKEELVVKQKVSLERGLFPA